MRSSAGVFAWKVSLWLFLDVPSPPCSCLLRPPAGILIQVNGLIAAGRRISGARGLSADGARDRIRRALAARKLRRSMPTSTSTSSPTPRIASIYICSKPRQLIADDRARPARPASTRSRHRLAMGRPRLRHVRRAQPRPAGATSRRSAATSPAPGTCPAAAVSTRAARSRPRSAASRSRRRGARRRLPWIARNDYRPRLQAALRVALRRRCVPTPRCQAAAARRKGLRPSWRRRDESPAQIL
jgi:hypothetical protein